MNMNISPPGQEEYPRHEGEVVDYQHDNYFSYNWQSGFCLEK